MDSAFQVCAYIVGLSLEILAISALIRRPVRQYFFCVAYLVVSVLTAVAEMPASMAYYRSGRTSTLYPFLYWIDEGFREVLVFAVVISLIYIATSKLGTRRAIRFVLIVGGLLFVGVSFLIHYNGALKLGMWMTPWTRDMKVCATVLDLALWALLISSRTVDQRLLLLSGALGIMFTGEAIGESLRTIATQSRSHGLTTTGGWLVVFADLLFYFIWWQAFRRDPAPSLAKAGYSGSAPGR